MSEDTVPLSHYSEALDEIFRLRQALAYEAQVLQAHLGYKTFPKSRRPFAEQQMDRMQQAARGEVQTAYADRSSGSMRYAMREAGAGELLTRSQFEEEKRL